MEWEQHSLSTAVIKKEFGTWRAGKELTFRLVNEWQLSGPQELWISSPAAQLLLQAGRDCLTHLSLAADVVPAGKKKVTH